MSRKINLENLLKSGSFVFFKENLPFILTHYTNFEFIQECSTTAEDILTGVK
jgi:hypothetical protein